MSTAFAFVYSCTKAAELPLVSNFWFPEPSAAGFRSYARQRLSDLDTRLEWLEIRTLKEEVSGSMTDKRLALHLIICFAVLGTVVSGAGVYATSALMAASRTKEIGIRMAMGARYIDILRLILSRGLRVLFIGLPCGLFAGWVLTRGLSSALFQVQSDDPFVWIIGCALLTGMTIIAALIPALRAARVNPLDALRGK
jgi:ABC-type antimicrobial peptide transport system permease subunit